MAATKDLDKLDGIQPVTPAVAVRELIAISKALEGHIDGVMSTALTDPGKFMLGFFCDFVQVP